MSGSVWIVSYAMLWVAVLVLGITVVALLRQIGVLHLRVAPMGVHFAGEGPELDRPAPVIDLDLDLDYAAAGITMLAFTSPTCEICATLKPDLQRLERRYDELRLRFIGHETDPGLFGEFGVRSTPYLVAVDRSGIVRSRGVANTIDQVEEMLAEVIAGRGDHVGAGRGDHVGAGRGDHVGAGSSADITVGATAGTSNRAEAQS